MAWDRGDTRIAYVVKVVRYAGRAVARIGGRLLVGFNRGQSAPTLIAGMTKALQSGGGNAALRRIFVIPALFLPKCRKALRINKTKGAKVNEKQVEAEEVSPSLQEVHPRQQPSDVEGTDPEHDSRRRGR